MAGNSPTYFSFGVAEISAKVRKCDWCGKDIKC